MSAAETETENVVQDTEAAEVQAEVTEPEAGSVAEAEGALDDQASDRAADSGVQAEESQEDWRRPYEELGFQGVETPEEAQQRLAEAYRREREQREEAERQAKYYQSIQAQLTDRTGTAQPEQQEAQSQETPSGVIEALASKWQEPSPTALERYITRDENGQEKFTPDAPEEFRRQVMEYAEQRQQWAQVISNPKSFAEAIDQRLEAVLASRVTDTLSQHEQHRADQQAEEEFFAQNDWLFERDPVTGQPTNRPTRDGQMFGQFLREAGSMGIQSRSQQLRVAMAMYQAQKSQAAQAPEQARQSARPVADQQRRKMLGAKNGQPSKPTTAAGVSDGPASKPTGANRMSLGERLVNDLQEEGYEL